MAMRRFRKRPDENDAVRNEPVDDLVGMLHEDAPQRQVVARGERAGEMPQVFEMLLRRVLDAGAPLMRRVGGRDGTHRPRGGSAGLGIFFQQHDAASQARRLGGRGEPGSTRAHHHDVENLSAHCRRAR